ncbi:MAG TPA: fibrillarin-like rRNA/tRNA 2'-O-methyltransferase [Thermoplasmata archaeon]|jgi:fibrillarin-like pre-rRNA processing protein|nr:fibrillarin-like rRNA/tRNA 2'-O-methyltransferase [Thermoplasmata archaeon]
MEPTDWTGVFREGRELYTVNAAPGTRVYGETLRSVAGTEYRTWDPFRSKLAAFLLRGGPRAIWGDAHRVLYLGAAHGTTVSHLLDVFPAATVVAIEKSPTAFAPLLALARRRANLLPILADAQLPERYQADVGAVDFLYQDVAQRNQAAIFAENAQACLPRGGRGVLMLKVRSVTQRRSAAAIVREAKEALARAGLTVDAESPLAPFSREHVALAVHA